MGNPLRCRDDRPHDQAQTLYTVEAEMIELSPLDIIVICAVSFYALVKMYVYFGGRNGRH